MESMYPAHVMKINSSEIKLLLGSLIPALWVILLSPKSYFNWLVSLSVMLGLFCLLWLQRHWILRDVKQLETMLEQLLSNQELESDEPETEWFQTSKKLRALGRYLGIVQQSLSDRESLISEQQVELKAREKELREAALAMAHAHIIQQEAGRSLDIESLLQQSTRMLMTYIAAHKGFFLKFDLHSENAQVMQPFHCALSEGQIVPANEMHHLLQRCSERMVRLYSFGEDPAQENVDLQEETHLLELSVADGPIYGVAYQHALLGPVWIDNELWGVFCLFDRETRRHNHEEPTAIKFKSKDHKLLVHVIQFLQKDLKTAHLFELATVDSLSGLYLRRYFEKRMTEEIRRAQRFKNPFSLLLLDIDHFKRFNDTYGHLTGDEVIQAVATIIKDQIRKDVDIAGRYGGEEMVIMLPQTPPEKAKIVAERLRRAIAEHQIQQLMGKQTLPHVTVSIGIAGFPQEGTTILGLIEHADIAMYKAKESGRNQVWAYTDLEDLADKKDAPAAT